LRKASDRDKSSAQQEAQLLKNLKHPNIVSYKESFQVDGFLHIVMLYCDGGDLYTKIKEQNGRYIEETQVVEWFVQIAMALQVFLSLFKARSDLVLILFLLIILVYAREKYFTQGPQDPEHIFN
jgi:serine/threonine protein kinase